MKVLDSCDEDKSINCNLLCAFYNHLLIIKGGKDSFRPFLQVF